MSEDTILDGFMEGFAKVAEANGFHGENVRTLLALGVDLAQGANKPEAFAEGFRFVAEGH